MAQLSKKQIAINMIKVLSLFIGVTAIFIAIFH